MEETIPQGTRKASEYQSEIDILRSRWTANGFQFTEANLQRVARANEQSRQASLKKRAQAECSDDDEVDDAWKQYDEEKAAEETEPEQEPQRAASSLDDTYQELLDEYSAEASAPEPETRSRADTGY
jgi:hypothetical protein